jgi:hypothetical protein
MQGVATAWTSAVHCWSPHIYIPSLSSSFAGAAYQILMRCSVWLRDSLGSPESVSPELAVAVAHDCHTLAAATLAVLLPSAVHVTTSGS